MVQYNKAAVVGIAGLSRAASGLAIPPTIPCPGLDCFNGDYQDYDLEKRQDQDPSTLIGPPIPSLEDLYEYTPQTPSGCKDNPDDCGIIEPERRNVLNDVGEFVKDRTIFGQFDKRETATEQEKRDAFSDIGQFVRRQPWSDGWVQEYLTKPKDPVLYATESVQHDKRETATKQKKRGTIADTLLEPSGCLHPNGCDMSNYDYGETATKQKKRDAFSDIGQFVRRQQLPWEDELWDQISQPIGNGDKRQAGTEQGNGLEEPIDIPRPDVPASSIPDDMFDLTGY